MNDLSTDSGAGHDVLTVHNVTLELADRTILEDLSFTLPNGSMLGLIGPNGSGKSSMLNVISGYYRAARGTVRVQGIDITDAPATTIARTVGRSFQSMAGIEQLTVREYVQIGADRRPRFGSWLPSGLVPNPRQERHSKQVATRLIVDAELGSVADRRLGSCSHGLRKVADVLRVFAGKPDVVLLDEPTSGVGRESSQQIHQLCADYVAQGQGALVVVDHDMAFIAEACDRAVALAAGRKVAEGEPRAVLGDPIVIETLLGG